MVVRVFLHHRLNFKSLIPLETKKKKLVPHRYTIMFTHDSAISIQIKV